MAKVTFEPGDVVQLKSGSTNMTVRSVSGNDVDCSWHDSSNKVVEHTYSSDMLKLATVAQGDAGDWQDNPNDI